MHKFVSLNGTISSRSEVNHSAISNASLYGKGVFTTVAILEGKPFLWQSHWQRLLRDAKSLGIDLSGYSIDKVRDLLESLIDTNECDNARCRLTFFDDSQSKIWTEVVENVTGVLIQTADLKRVEAPVALTTSPYPINSLSPLAGVKSCNYLENILAKENAVSLGFTEAIRINERNEIASACMANVFWIKDETLYTPSLRTGCLAGTTRDYILDNRSAFEVEANLAELDNVDSIFLTSAGIGIVQVGKFNETILDDEPHELTKIFGFNSGNSATTA